MESRKSIVSEPLGLPGFVRLYRCSNPVAFQVGGATMAVRAVVFSVSFLAFSVVCVCFAASDDCPLPSWGCGPAKEAIVDFVERVITKGCPEYVPPEERIAVFDNDGTLWSEQPAYFQLLFAIDCFKKLLAENPQLKMEQPCKGVFEGDPEAIAKLDIREVGKLVMESHAGMPTDQFKDKVRDWLRTARHPKLGRPYNELIFQPMLELLDYLRKNGFKTYIVSGGSIGFLRAFAEDVYGIPSEQVIGTSVKTQYEVRDGKPVIVRLAEIEFLNNKSGKPVGINKFIGRRPIAAFGNSDGDLQMLQWTAAGEGPRFCLIVHHTDDRREWAYEGIRVSADWIRHWTLPKHAAGSLWT